MQNYDVHVKTKIFVSPGARLKPFFYHLCTQVFKSEIEIFNASNALMESEQINKWVADQTKDHVTTLFQLGKINHLINQFIISHTIKIIFSSQASDSIDSSFQIKVL